MRIVPIASGKGGVGKSLIAVNLAIALAQADRKVILVDLDLGGSNIHTMLGMRSVDKGIGTFLSDTKRDFGEIIVPTDYSGMLFVAGDAEMPGIANLKASQKKMIIRRLAALEADYVVLDLGAGTNYNILDFFLITSGGIVVSTPSLTATLNTYLFLKNCVFRIIATSFKQRSAGLKYLTERMKDSRSLRRLYIPDLMAQVEKVDPEGHTEAAGRLGRFRPNLIYNLLEDPEDAAKAGKLRRSCREYLAVDLQHLGIVYRDELQDSALNSGLPILRYKPQSVLSQAIYRIADKVIQAEGSETADENFVGGENVDEGYEIAALEAEIDFRTKMDHLEELLHCGALTSGDLIETIKTQAFEINQLKKESQLLKTKLVKAIREGYEV
jgi:flagellar biosynthesis protein FlhG